MLNKILSLVFGKEPDIFDVHGNVLHKLPDHRWSQWRERFEKSRNYDWRQHVGTERIVRKPKN